MRNSFSPSKKTYDTFFYRNRFFCITGIYFAISLVVYLFCRNSQPVADFISEYIGGAIRFVLATITSVLPFSIAEVFLLLFFPVTIIFFFFAPDKNEGRFMTRNGYIILGVLLLILAIYFSAFAPCYFRTPVGEELSLDRESVSKTDIYNAIVAVSGELEKLEDDVTSASTGETLMPHSYSELVSKLNKAYDSLSEKYDFFSDFYSYPKPLAISNIMPYTRISGFYTFFSGEANISTAYPDFTLPFTMAHEMAHQRGIAKEDEANFVAFLVCMESDDSYIRYSGYTEILNYLSDSLYEADKELYWLASSRFPSVYKNEYSAYIRFVRGSDVEKVSNVTDAINNTMLQSQGQTAGSESYGLVSELAGAYYKTLKVSENN